MMMCWIMRFNGVTLQRSTLSGITKPACCSVITCLPMLFHLASQIDSLAAIRRLALASNRVCGGEMKQNAWSGDFDISEVDYLQMVSEKTAELCSCACYCGAHLSAASESTSEAFSQFGLNLGIAFQIVDDILDLVGDTQTVGKTLGTDLKNRKTDAACYS